MAEETVIMNDEHCEMGVVKLTTPLLTKLLVWARDSYPPETDIYMLIEKVNHYCSMKAYLGIEDLSLIKPVHQYVPDELPVAPIEPYVSRAYR